MIRKLFVLALLASLGGLTGCSMCCHPFDYDYPAFGGVAPRVDPCHGRVGSRFQPAGAYTGDAVYEEEPYYEEMPQPAQRPTGVEARRPGR